MSKKKMSIEDLIAELTFYSEEIPDNWRDKLDFLRTNLPTASVVMTYENVVGTYRKCIEYKGDFYEYAYCDNNGYHSLWENGYNTFGWYGTILEKLPKDFIKSVSYDEDSQAKTNNLGMTQN